MFSFYFLLLIIFKNFSKFLHKCDEGVWKNFAKIHFINQFELFILKSLALCNIIYENKLFF